jgi:hypothetical protein
MATVITFSETNLVGAVVTDSITNLNFGSVDEPNIVVADHKVTVGNNSYEKYLRVNVDLDSGTVLSNMKFWKSSGAYVTGEAIKAIANQTYSTPVATTSAKAVADVPIVVGSALAIESTEVDPTLFTEDGYSEYLVLQAQSTVSTPTGAGNQKIFTLQFDES